MDELLTIEEIEAALRTGMGVDRGAANGRNPPTSCG